MKNKVLNKKIYEARNNATISNSSQECYTSFDNIPFDTLYDELDDFFYAIDFDMETAAEFIDMHSLFVFYDLLINTYPEDVFFECVETFYIIRIKDFIEMVNKWYDSNEFYTLAKNLFVNTNDIIEMHKLQNKVVDSAWFNVLFDMHETLYGDEIEDFIQMTKCSNESKIKVPDRLKRFNALTSYYQVSDYEDLINSDEFKEFFCEY